MQALKKWIPEPPPKDSAPRPLIKDLPRSQFLLVVLGASVLSLIGGYMNGMSLGGMFGVGITHLTGPTTNAAVTLVNKSVHPPAYFFEIIAGHALGATIAGYVVGQKRSRWRGKQAFVLTIEAVCLWITFFAEMLHELHGYNLELGAFMVCVACGLQNGVTSNLEMITIRSTAVTGVVNDIFLSLGQCLREGFAKHRWKLLLWTPSFLSFWVGAMFGCLAWRHIGASGTAFPAVSITVLAILSWVITWRAYYGKKQIAPEPAISTTAETNSPSAEEEEAKTSDKI